MKRINDYFKRISDVNKSPCVMEVLGDSDNAIEQRNRFRTKYLYRTAMKLSNTDTKIQVLLSHGTQFFRCHGYLTHASMCDKRRLPRVYQAQSMLIQPSINWVTIPRLSLSGLRILTVRVGRVDGSLVHSLEPFEQRSGSDTFLIGRQSDNHLCLDKI
jgi:hypothetical protein